MKTETSFCIISVVQKGEGCFGLQLLILIKFIVFLVTINLIECMQEHNIKDVVFSSSATVYGMSVMFFLVILLHVTAGVKFLKVVINLSRS